MRDLTPKEIEIVKLAAMGKKRKEIAAILKVKEGTINTHFKSIYIKTGVRSMAQLIIWAISKQYV